MTGPPGSRLGAAVGEWHLSIGNCDGWAQVSVRGELDVQSAPELDAVLRELEATADTVLVDLRGLTFMDSSGINLLIGHDARTRSDGFELSIIAPKPGVARAWEYAGVEELLTLVDAPPPPPREASPR